MSSAAVSKDSSNRETEALSTLLGKNIKTLEETSPGKIGMGNNICTFVGNPIEELKKISNPKIQKIAGSSSGACGKWCGFILGNRCNYNSPWFPNSCQTCYKKPSDWFFGTCI